MSSDDAPNVVANYQSSVKYKVIYIREPDNGRYQGMNKGIKAATGEYLLFLNAGDYLHDKDVIKKVTSQLDKEIVYGDIKGKSLANFNINSQFFIDRTLFHQATFIKKDLFEKHGLYDESLVISSDFDFFIKNIIKFYASTKYIPIIVTDYDTTGISSSQSDLVYEERAKVITRYYTGKTYIYHLLKYLYYHYKKYLPKSFVSIQQKRLEAQPKI